MSLEGMKKEYVSVFNTEQIDSALECNVRT